MARARTSFHSPRRITVDGGSDADLAFLYVFVVALPGHDLDCHIFHSDSTPEASDDARPPTPREPLSVEADASSGGSHLAD